MMRVDAWYLAVAPCDMRLGMDEAQRKLFEEALAENLSAAEQKIADLKKAPANRAPKRTHPVRQSLPDHLERVDVVQGSRSGLHAREFLRQQMPPPQPGAPPGTRPGVAT